MAENRNSPVCFDADINLFAPVEEANCAHNGVTIEDSFTLPSAKVGKTKHKKWCMEFS